MITNTYNRWQVVSVYSVTHFLVDFACAFMMFRSIAGTSDWYLCLLLYNFCAFAMQMPLGILADKWNRNFLFAAIGCILVGAAYGLCHVPILAAITVGIGNGMFHVGGGIDILNISEKDSGPLGVFVSPGAFGIYFGTMLGKGSGLSAVPILLALVVAIGFIFAVRWAQREKYPKNAEFSLDGAAILHEWANVPYDRTPAPDLLTKVVCLFLVVCLRSYVGLTLSFPWKGVGYWGAALVCAVALGKTAGGFLADRFGAIKTSNISLFLAALLFLFPQIPAAGVLSLLLFNMTMPITLWAMAKVFPGAKGFSFGLLTFGLFLGFLPVHLGGNAILSTHGMSVILTIVSLELLNKSFRKADS